ncbi:MAG: hypothetical protein ACE3JP_17220 [Ectobacillus sp.]
MKLYSSLSAFVEYANRQEHLLPLLPPSEKAICFQFKEECCSLHLSHEGMFVSKDKCGTDKVILKEEQNLEQLISGEVRLQLLLRRKGAEYSGTYRSLLLLESLFHICKPLDLGA